MIKVKLRDDIREFESGISAMEVAKSIGAGLYKAVCVCRINGEVKDLREKLTEDCELEFVTFDDEDGDKYFFPDGTALPTDIVLTKIE